MSNKLRALLAEADIALDNPPLKFKGITKAPHTESPEAWLKEIGATENADGSYNVAEDINVPPEVVENGKLMVKIKKAAKSFFCANQKLTTLEGCPQEVGNDYAINNNLLTSLKGCPKKVPGDFLCGKNKLTSLDGAPAEVGGEFWISDNPGKFSEEDVRAVCDVGGRVRTRTL